MSMWHIALYTILGAVSLIGVMVYVDSKRGGR